MFGSKERREREQREAKAAHLEREARDQDRRAWEHGRWAVSEMREGRPDHSKMWAEYADRNAREADRLRAEAERLRRR